jgi:hypothetical protein
MTYFYHIDGTMPTYPAIWVFGSNLSGIHGAGAARVALDKYGAVFGVGVGPMGSAYAIPTKDQTVQRTLRLDVIQLYIDQFKEHVSRSHDETFFVTRIGCGLAGFRDDQIAPMFKGINTNCSFADEWKEYLEC